MHNKARNWGKLASVLIVGCLGLWSQPIPSQIAVPMMTVGVCNSSGLSAHALAKSLRRVEEAYKAAEIGIEWAGCALATPDARAASDGRLTGRVQLTILPKPQLRSPLRSDEVFGTTSAGSAYVFHQRLRQFARLYEVPESDVVAIVIAHELAHAVGVGHLSNSLTRGLMSARFGPRDVLAFGQKLR